MAIRTLLLRASCMALLCASTAFANNQEEAPIILGADTPITQTDLHAQMLQKYGTWLGLHSFCKGEVPKDSLMMQIGFHLTFAPQVLSPFNADEIDLKDPSVFSIVQSRHLVVQEKAAQVLRQVALESPSECDRYESIEQEAQRFFKVKGISDVAQKSVKNFRDAKTAK